MMKRFLSLLLLFAPIALPAAVKEHTLHIVTTGDLHGAWFDGTYSENNGTRTSLYAVKASVDAIRGAVGAENVLLIDAGDCLQGDNAAYYYNYVAVSEPHLFPLMASYMGYDAVVVGNHDIETGHAVYDRVRAELEAKNIPWLGGNALKPDGQPYFQEYKVFNRAGLKVLVLGYTNANIKSWLKEELWKGMTFESLTEMVQTRVDAIKSKEKPQVTVVAIHAGTGAGDGKQLENQGLDLMERLKGVDLIIAAHDHKVFTKESEGIAIVNGGARAGNIGHGIITVNTRGRKVVSKSVAVETVRIDKRRIDKEMKAHFQPWYEAVKVFSNRPVGELSLPLVTRDAFRGECPYIDFVHSVQLAASGASVSFAAPLTFNRTVPAGRIVYSDLFTIYPFENELFTVRLTGEEIRRYLEYSYDMWVGDGAEHAFRILDKPDARTGSSRWSFVGRTYNFDSAAGLNYTVDITAPKGSRVRIASLADGSRFDLDATYTVAMTSYRASGGGGHLPKGVGLTDAEVEARTSGVFPEIRELVYEFIKAHPSLTAGDLSNRAVLGNWRFVPEGIAGPLLEKDMNLVFRKK